ncbi:C2H2-type zinc binding domain-containing protein spindle-F isoform X1 [Xylocopa sonorina]|uniref:C2H2-type zinc binding domain-containing protein spindle-F isoform X1 n=2 Tax=Xylocopa sonorina TaxID=1818115 RepID=UPI00403AC63A
MEQSENSDNEKFGSYYALLVAFKTMNERCQQLETRLATVEEENMCLRLECGKHESEAITKPNDSNEKTTVQTLKEKIEELKKQKSQLTHQVFMVAAENRQLWNRLTKLTRTNKSLGSQLTKISDTLKQHSPAQPSDIVSYSFRDVSNSAKEDNNQQNVLTTNNGKKEESLEEISLRLINSIMLEKSDLEQQYAEMVELQNSTDLDLRNIGFTYPEDSDTDLELFKQHDIRLSQMKDTLLAQQTKLKRALQNFRKKKGGLMCNSCRMNANKKMCQASTQFNFNENIKEHGATQTSLQTPSLSLEKCTNSTDNIDQDNRICPLCGSFYGKATTFQEFHEHVLSHFNKEVTVDSFEIVH